MTRSPRLRRPQPGSAKSCRQTCRPRCTAPTGSTLVYRLLGIHARRSRRRPARSAPEAERRHMVDAPLADEQLGYEQERNLLPRILR